MVYNPNNIEIKIVKTWPKKEIIELYKLGGWWKDYYDPSGIDTLIKGSFAFVVVIDKNTKKAVGMGRLISDGISDAYIQDLIISPRYRNKGIGKKLVNKLLNYCHTRKIEWIGLISEPNQEGFYKSLGFKKMKKYTPMKFKKEK